MIAPECRNPHCRRTVADGSPVCAHCWAELARRLPDLLDDLLVTLTRQDRLGTGAGKRGKGAEQPLPVRLDVGAAIDAVSGELTTWARELVERNGWTVPDPPHSPHPRLALARYAARFLAGHIGYLRTHPAALEAFRGITAAVAAADAKMDKPESQLFIGVCECGANLYSRPRSPAIVCEWCRALIRDVDARWDRALFKLRGYPATAATIADDIAKLYDIQVNRLTISKWHSLGKLTPVDWVPLGEHGNRTAPRFRIGAVLDLAARSKPRKAG